jgi:hypothetical protein
MATSPVKRNGDIRYLTLQLKEIEMKDSRLTKNTVEKRLTASVMSFHFSPPALPTWTKNQQLESTQQPYIYTQKGNKQ